MREKVVVEPMTGKNLEMVVGYMDCCGFMEPTYIGLNCQTDGIDMQSRQKLLKYREEIAVGYRTVFNNSVFLTPNHRHVELAIIGFKCEN